MTRTMLCTALLALLVSWAGPTRQAGCLIEPWLCKPPHWVGPPPKTVG